MRPGKRERFAISEARRCADDLEIDAAPARGDLHLAAAPGQVQPREQGTQRG